MKIHEFDPVIYPYKLWVIIDKSMKEIPDLFVDRDRNPLDHLRDEDLSTEAVTIAAIRKEDFRRGVMLFFRSKKSMTYKLVAHEACHAAKFLFEHIDADMREHEPFEYVVGWIAECCEIVKKGGKK